MSAYGDAWASIREALRRDRQTRQRPVQEAEFLPAALELVERPVSPLARRTAYVLFAGMAVLLLWLMIGRVEIVASAEGELQPSAHIQLVQPGAAGIVRHLRVREGQHVAKGQVLVDLDPALANAELGQGRDALLAAEMTAARARAILGALAGDGFHFAPPADAPPSILADHAALARAQLAQLQAQSGEQGASRQASALAASEARIEARKIGESLPLLDQQLAANEALLAKGYVSKLRVLDLRRQRLAAQRDRDAALKAAARAGAEARASQLRGLGAGAAGRAELLQSLVAAEAEIAQRRGDLAKAADRAGYGRLVAPVSGTVAQLAVTTEGGVIEAMRPVMAIVPDGSLTAEVKLANKDVAFVHKGQKVALKVHAYPFSRYGTIAGRIISIGAVAVPDDRLGLVYPVRVAVDRSSAGRLRLRPGMAVTADIETGSRRLIDYLTSPIERAAASAGRER
ncbi:MAG: HlyD family type I secretion periplasmic adaptor subunit [Chakrabartia sp.]